MLSVSGCLKYSKAFPELEILQIGGQIADRVGAEEKKKGMEERTYRKRNVDERVKVRVGGFNCANKDGRTEEKIAHQSERQKCFEREAPGDLVVVREKNSSPTSCCTYVRVCVYVGTSYVVDKLVFCSSFL